MATVHFPRLRFHRYCWLFDAVMRATHSTPGWCLSTLLYCHAKSPLIISLFPRIGCSDQSRQIGKGLVLCPRCGAIGSPFINCHKLPAILALLMSSGLASAIRRSSTPDRHFLSVDVGVRTDVRVCKRTDEVIHRRRTVPCQKYLRFYPSGHRRRAPPAQRCYPRSTSVAPSNADIQVLDCH